MVWVIISILFGTHGYIYDLILQIKKKANDRGVDCSTLIAQLEEDHQEVS